MCLERDPRHCHRLLVAERIAALSPLAVVHLHPAAPAKPAEPKLL
jgi:hypothetical protein